jgi:hypothetical protein
MRVWGQFSAIGVNKLLRNMSLRPQEFIISQIPDRGVITPFLSLLSKREHERPESLCAGDKGYLSYLLCPASCKFFEMMKF